MAIEFLIKGLRFKNPEEYTNATWIEPADEKMDSEGPPVSIR